MKRVFILLLILIIALSASACKGEKNQDKES